MLRERWPTHRVAKSVVEGIRHADAARAVALLQAQSPGHVECRSPERAPPAQSVHYGVPISTSRGTTFSQSSLTWRNRVGCRRHDLDEVDAELGVLLHAGQEGVGWPEAVFRPGQPLSAWPWRTCSAKWYEWPKRSVRRRPDRTTGGIRATTGGRYRRMRDARDGGRLRASATSISTSHISVSHERGRVARARKRLRGPTVVADPPEGLLGPRD